MTVLTLARDDAAFKNFVGSATKIDKYEITYPQGCLDAYANKHLDNPVGYESGQLINLNKFAKAIIEVVASLP
jgi:hypothetical protein